MLQTLGVAYPAIIVKDMNESISFYRRLGLRALYFLLAGVADRFVYLKTGLAVILAFVGTKMLIADFYHLPVWLSLSVIATVLAVSVIASLRSGRRLDPTHDAPLPDPLGLLSDGHPHEGTPTDGPGAGTGSQRR